MAIPTTKKPSRPMGGLILMLWLSPQQRKKSRCPTGGPILMLVNFDTWLSPQQQKIALPHWRPNSYVHSTLHDYSIPKTKQKSPRFNDNPHNERKKIAQPYGRPYSYVNSSASKP